MATPEVKPARVPQRGSIALLDVSEEREQFLRERLGEGYEFKCFSGHEPLVSALDLGTVSIDTLVIGEVSENRLDTALAVRRTLRHLQVIVLAKQRDVEGLNKRAAIQSDGGDEVEIWPCQELEELPKVIRRAIKRAHRRVSGDTGGNGSDEGQDAGAASVTEYLDKLLEHAPIGMLTIDVNEEVVALNKRARVLLGASRSKLINRRIQEFFPPIEHRRLRRVLDQDANNLTEDSGEVLRLEVPNSEGGTQIRHLEVIFAGPVTRQGESCVMIILHDVTGIVDAQLAQRKTAAALQASEDRFNELAEVMRMVPWEADPQTLRVTYVGKLVETIMGYPRDRWLSKRFWLRCVHPDDRRRALRTVNRNSRRLQNFDFEFRMHDKDGRVHWLRNIVNVMRDAEGKLEKIRGFVVDITERKESRRRQPAVGPEGQP